MTGNKRLDALQAAALAASSASGGPIFQELTRYLATILHCELALVGELAGDKVRTLGVFGQKGYVENFEYPLAVTPCNDVVGRKFMVVPEGVAARYPKDVPLSRFGAVGYAGYPLNAPDGTPVGVLAILSQKRLVNRALIESVMKIFAVRAEAELVRRRHEERLRASEEQYRAIFNASADSLVLRDADFRVVDVNPAYEAMSGRPRAEALGRSDLTMSPPELTERVRAGHQRALAGEPVVFEALARRKDGSRFDIETRGVPILHQGRPHVLYIGRDITARKRAEEVLRASEEQYRAIFNAAADALVLRDADFRIVDVNPAYEQMSGYTRDEVIGLARVVVSPPQMESHFRTLHQRALAGETVTFETVRVSKHGKRRDVELRGVPIQYRGKLHVLYIGRDISERKRAEEQLRASEEQYRAIFNAAADALVLRDSQARVVDVNPAFLQISGFTREEVLNDNRWVFALPELGDLAREMHGRVIAGESVQFEIRARRKDGTPLDIEMRAVPIVYRGEPHALGMARDITQRKGLESRLRQAQRMEALGHVTGGVAHDFNNLLAAIMGYVALAAEREASTKDAKLPGYLDKALASCRQARDLIQQMLTFSRGQRGSPRPLALGGAAAESLKLLRGSFPSSMQIETLFEEVPAVMLDPVQLDQILLNLSINARDAMAGHGRIEIGVRAAALREKAVCASCGKRFRGAFAELSVADSGPGIAPQVIERMFEPFFTTKEVGRGSGMGLATVHGIVHEHEGHILVESALGAGSRFRILLPTHTGDVPAPKAAKPAGQRKTALSGRVLVVDDEPAVADVMRELLESWGLEATTLLNPAGVLDRIARQSPAYDFVILDQTMPGVTGMSLAREIAAAHPQLPVVLCTGNSTSIEQEELDAAGVRALLHKPVEPEQLYGLLRTHLH